MTEHRILVVVDQPLDRMVIAEQVATLGHACVCAEHIDEALALLEARAFDLVLLDCDMPGVEAFSTSVPVIGVSDDIATHAALASRIGVRAFVARPVSLAMLDDALRTFLSRHAVHARIESAHWSLFARTSRDDLRAAHAALESGNEPAVHLAVHRIKGAALMIGAAFVAEACVAVEAALAHWHPALLARRLDAVGACLDDADARHQSSR
jgi:two-component system, NarL family, capsular synthesis sensor histidine kinase RcsC